MFIDYPVTGGGGGAMSGGGGARNGGGVAMSGGGGVSARKKKRLNHGRSLNDPDPNIILCSHQWRDRE